MISIPSPPVAENPISRNPHIEFTAFRIVWLIFSLGLAGLIEPTFAAPAAPALRLEARSNAWDLLVDSLSETGALFVYQAPDVPTLLTRPTLLLQTNTPLTGGLRHAVLSTNDSSTQAFYSAIFWIGRSIDEFGDPEMGEEPSAPPMVLITAGVPATLISGQALTVQFFVTNPNGQLLDVSGEVAIFIVREPTGVVHPDAQCFPASGQLIGGVLELELTLQSTTSLDGYTFGLGLASTPLGRFPASPLVQPLLNSCILSPDPLADVTPQEILDAEQRFRHINADNDTSWSYPLPSPVPVSGTYGEWRGQPTAREPTGHVHQGLDLAAMAGSRVIASRGGVVSARGSMTTPPMGDFIVIDHGDGWFSRYLHLDPHAIVVSSGQPVPRQATLATALYSAGNWPVHLHFEVRRGTDLPHWRNPFPGESQDPLQTGGTFPVQPGVAFPMLKQFRLTGYHLGQYAVEERPPAMNSSGRYLFAQFVDPEPKQGDTRRLGVRAVRFQAEGTPQPDEIRPWNAAAIAPLRPRLLKADQQAPKDQEHGFARYEVNVHITQAGEVIESVDQSHWFRYWWLWDTSRYVDDCRGPRTFILTGEDYANNTTNYFFSFGPQIMGGTITSVGAQRYRFTLVAHLGTNTSVNSMPELVQQDQYDLEILLPSGQAIVDWEGPRNGNYTKVFTRHLDEADYTFTLPAGLSPEGLKVRVSSRLAPDIAHEVYLTPNIEIRPPTDSSGVYRVILARTTNAANQPAVTYQLRLVSGTWQPNQPDGQLSSQDSSILVTRPIGGSAGPADAYFDLTVAQPTDGVLPRVVVSSGDGAQRLAEASVPTALVLDDFAKDGTFVITLDGSNLGVFTQIGPIGKTIDISNWARGETHRLELFLSAFSGFRGCTFVLWLPPWVNFTKVTRYRLDGTILDETTPNSSEVNIDMQRIGLFSLQSDRAIVEIQRVGP